MSEYPERPSNLPPRQDDDPQVKHPANQADESWAELERLRLEARSLGLEVDERWPLLALREQVAAARAR